LLVSSLFLDLSLLAAVPPRVELQPEVDILEISELNVEYAAE
jgi:hypothetical protein